ncbi:MAG: hypothetical protein G01um101430_701 [Parcubacteria group bacterium Gr01-1014_30]|nr:MAG: hypothetical protein G01um101430_701 [Parcubacteria group bacterium Gr01-1014_30]
MVFTVIIVVFSLILLIILHELGHFLVAKKFGVKVEEFGVFLPPRLFDKKIGETIYSLNLIPLGAFVRVLGEEGEAGIHDIRSFASKPIWQRAAIVAGGVVSFWLVAAFLMSFVMWLGSPTAVSDDDKGLLINPKVQISMIASASPAQAAGLRVGDTIRKFEIRNSKFEINKVKEVQELTEQYKGQEIILQVERGKEVFNISLVPRVSPPEGEGAMGVVLVRTALERHPWYLAPIKGIEATLTMTGNIIAALAGLLSNLVLGKGVPPGADLTGPVGIVALMTQFFQLGLANYLQFIAAISIYLAIFNILPIPALDGGKLMFLFIEKVKGRSVNQKLEQKVTAFFFSVLLLLIALITIRDITRLF